MRNKENNYNIIRFVCACLVIYGHMFILYGYPATSLYANEISGLGFKMLMVLSGLMITQSCLYDKNFFRYALKRIFRIFPALIVCVTLTTVVLGSLVTTLSVPEYLKHPGTWSYLFNNIILRPAYLLPGVFENNTYAGAVNGSLWALPVEFALYFIIYILIIVSDKLKCRKQLIVIWAVGVCVLRVIVYRFFKSESFEFLGTSWSNALNVFPFFACGSIFAVTEWKKYCNLQVASLILVVTLAIGGFDFIIIELMAVFSLTYFLISLGEAENPIFKNCFKKTDLSYGMYLWGFPVQQTLIYIFRVKYEISISVNVYFVLTMVIVLVLAFATWHLVEKPMQKVMKSLTAKIK